MNRFLIFVIFCSLRSVNNQRISSLCLWNWILKSKGLIMFEWINLEVSLRSPQQYIQLFNRKENIFVCLMNDVWTEISSNNAIPAVACNFVHFSFDVICDSFFFLKFFESVECCFLNFFLIWIIMWNDVLFVHVFWIYLNCEVSAWHCNFGVENETSWINLTNLKQEWTLLFILVPVISFKKQRCNNYQNS